MAFVSVSFGWLCDRHGHALVRETRAALFGGTSYGYQRGTAAPGESPVFFINRVQEAIAYRHPRYREANSCAMSARAENAPSTMCNRDRRAMRLSATGDTLDCSARLH